MNNYFIWSKHDETQPRTQSIIDKREEENMNVPDHLYSHHERGGEDDVGENDEGLDVEELMHNVAPGVLLQCRSKGFNNFTILDKVSRDLLYEECKGCHKQHIVLWMTVELLEFKASNEWSDSSFKNFEILDKASRDILYKECKGCHREHTVLWMTLELLKL
jgi:hypothetical protein